MKFHYIATDPTGKVVEGDIEAQGSTSVLGWMSEKGLKPVSIQEKEKKFSLNKSLGEKITLEDKVFITRYLALMLRVGTDLFRALEVLASDFDKQVVKTLLSDVRETLSKGQPLHVAFERYPQSFSKVFVSLIKAGEDSGNLESVFQRLSVDLEKEKELKAKVKGALIYPILLVALSLVVLLVMVTVALPKIAETFLSGGVDPPAFSKAVFGLGLFLRDYIWFVMPLLLGLMVGTWYFFSKTVLGKSLGYRMINRLPVIRDVIQKVALQRFAATLASLLRSGTPILDALDTTAEAVGSDQLKTVLNRISKEGIAKGLTVGEAFKKEPYFPKVVVNLIGISEKSGHMEEVLDTLSNFYEGEIDSSIKILVSFLEPALLLSIGLIVGLIAMAIIIPIYQLVGQI